MEGVNELIATIIGIVVLGLPILMWALFSSLRRRRRRAGAIGSEKAPGPPTRDEHDNWLSRIKNHDGQEEAPATREPDYTAFRPFEAIDHGLDRPDEWSVFADRVMTDSLADRGDVDWQGTAGGPLPVSDDGLGAVRSPDSWKRIEGLPPLKRAIVLSEILGPPAALK